MTVSASVSAEIKCSLSVSVLVQVGRGSFGFGRNWKRWFRSLSKVQCSWRIVCQCQCLWTAHREMEQPMTAVTKWRCVLWCADWDTPVLTYAISWTSVRPVCRRCAAPPATSAVPSAVGVRVIMLAFDERSLQRCSAWCRMERWWAQCCSSRSW